MSILDHVTDLRCPNCDVQAEHYFAGYRATAIL
jgi:hypothetical protein